MQKLEQYPLAWIDVMHSQYGHYAMYRNVHPALIPMVANTPLKYSHDKYVESVRRVGLRRIRRLLESQLALRDNHDEVIIVLEKTLALFEDVDSFNIEKANASLDLAINEINNIGRWHTQ